MTRKGIPYIIVLLFIASCFSACGQTAALHTENRETTEAETVESIPTVSWVSSDREEPLIDIDSDREIYFTCHNQYFTIYRLDSCNPTLQFNIISKKPLDMGTLQIDIPIESSYSVMTKEFIPEGIDTSTVITGDRADNVMAYPYYLYACSQGMDYAGLWAYFNAGTQASTAAQYTAYEELYNNCMNRYWADYTALRAEDLRQFYCYAVGVAFVQGGSTAESLLQAKEESFTYIDITIEGITYREIIGEIRLASILEAEGLQNDYEEGGLMNSGALFPYSNGIWEQYLYAFTAEQDMTLTGLTLDNSRLKMHDIVVVYSGQGIQSNMEWNGKDPLPIYAGDEIMIFAVLEDLSAASLDYATKAWAVLAYETNSGKYFKASECTIGTGVYTMNMHELYAIVFEGLDTSAYWEDYVCHYQRLGYFWRE